MYQGRTAAQAGLVFGHENMGIVEELGSGVTLLKKGDRVVIPFNVADGRVCPALPLLAKPLPVPALCVQ